MDGLPRYEYVIPKIPLFDDLFVFEPTDRDVIKEKLNLSSKFLTLAFNPDKYFFRQHGNRFDFSFVGSFYPKREEYLNALLGVSDNMCIYGDFYRTKFPLLKQKMKKVNVPYNMANDLYNESKINVNIHHPQSKEGMAIRTFEIIGAGGFQIVERQKGALQYFEENKHMVFYDDLSEFIEKSKYYLAHDTEREEIAANGHRIALEKHTWKARIQEMESML